MFKGQLRVASAVFFNLNYSVAGNRSESPRTESPPRYEFADNDQESRAVAGKPHDDVIKFDRYRNLKRHRTVLCAIARLSCLKTSGRKATHNNPKRTHKSAIVPVNYPEKIMKIE